MLLLMAGLVILVLSFTVVDCTTPIPTLLRSRRNYAGDAAGNLGEIEIDPALEEANIIPRSPGMKYTHYAPSSPMIVEGDAEQAAALLLVARIRQDRRKGRRWGCCLCWKQQR